MGACQLRWQAQLGDIIFSPVFIIGGDLKERVSFSQQASPSGKAKFFVSGSGFFSQDLATVVNPCQAWFGHLGPLSRELRGEVDEAGVDL